MKTIIFQPYGPHKPKIYLLVIAVTIKEFRITYPRRPKRGDYSADLKVTEDGLVDEDPRATIPAAMTQSQ